MTDERRGLWIQTVLLLLALAAIAVRVESRLTALETKVDALWSTQVRAER